MIHVICPRAFFPTEQMPWAALRVFALAFSYS